MLLRSHSIDEEHSSICKYTHRVNACFVCVGSLGHHKLSRTHSQLLHRFASYAYTIVGRIKAAEKYCILQLM